MSVKFKSNLSGVISQIKSNKENSVDEIGKFLSDRVKEKAPVDTGALRDSVDYDTDENSATIGASAKHSQPVELGSSRAKAQPFLEPTVKEHLGDIEEITEKNMSKM